MVGLDPSVKLFEELVDHLENLETSFSHELLKKKKAESQFYNRYKIPRKNKTQKMRHLKRVKNHQEACHMTSAKYLTVRIILPGKLIILRTTVLGASTRRVWKNLVLKR